MKWFVIHKREREDVDTGFCQIYAQSARMTEKVDTIPDMPRITARQQHRSNASSSSPEEYFKRNIAIPFLDHVICCIDQKFSQSATTASSLLGFVPQVLCTKDLSLEKALVTYHLLNSLIWSLSVGKVTIWQCHLNLGLYHRLKQSKTAILLYFQI